MHKSINCVCVSNLKSKGTERDDSAPTVHGVHVAVIHLFVKEKDGGNTCANTYYKLVKFGAKYQVWDWGTPYQRQLRLK